MRGTGRRAPGGRLYGHTLTVLLLSSALAACGGSGTVPGPDPSDTGSAEAGASTTAVPMSTTTPPAVTQAPQVTALPETGKVPVRPLANANDGYGYLDRAYYQEDAVEDAPPDYSFDEGGVRPWTWATADGARVICEPVAGGYRYFYYAAGADAPYLVRDPQYSYAYDHGALVAAYTLAGAPVNLAPGSPPVLYGGRYLDRGRMLWHHGNTVPHQAINAYAWSDRRADLADQRVAWQGHMEGNPGWSQWNGAHHDEEQHQWAEVRAQHESAAQSFGSWQQQHFQGPAPQFYGEQPAGAPPGPEHPAADHGTAAGAVVGGAAVGGAAAMAAHNAMAHGNPPAKPAPSAPPEHSGPEHPGAPWHQAVPEHAAPAAPHQEAHPGPAPHPIDHGGHAPEHKDHPDEHHP
jgi:hypothetical protein